MKRKELINEDVCGDFKLVKNPLVSMVYTKIFQRLKGLIADHFFNKIYSDNGSLSVYRCMLCVIINGTSCGFVGVLFII